MARVAPETIYSQLYILPQKNQRAEHCEVIMSFDKKWILSQGFRVHPLERIVSKCTKDKNGCWNYTGSLDSCGYGIFKIEGRNLGAHKVSYILHNGDFDQDIYEMMHDCHNRRCINPEHIKAGTHKQNMSYSDTRKRMRDSKLSGCGGSVYNLIARKRGETMLFGSSGTAKRFGLSSGSISESCNNVKYRGKYKGFKWSYESFITNYR